MPPRALVRGCAFRAAIHPRWCPERGSNPHALFREAADFKSAASANFAIRAAARLSDRRRDHPPAWAYAQIWHSWLEGSRSHGVALAGTGKPQPASTESTITTQANLSIRPPVGSRYQARAIADPANGVRAGGAPHCSRLQWIRSVEDRQRGMHSWKGGGASRSRTGLNGFAIRCITALLSRRLLRHCPTSARSASSQPRPQNDEGEAGWLPLRCDLERERSLELPTSTLARLRSTN
jgi:hypothetical protein